MSKHIKVNWPRSIPGERGRGVIRSKNADFRVWEQGITEPEGVGEHLWVWLQKENWTTAAVSSVLSRWAGVPVRQISYAGQKDRHAITEQWFSIHLPGRPDPDMDWSWPVGIKLLEKRRHNRKLRRGSLSGNRFQITIRHCTDAPDNIEQRLERISQNGVPNYFTEQRFGRDGQNVQRALAFWAGRSRPNRATRSMLISAVRSWLFNQVLAVRVIENNWHQACRGDLMMLSGSHSVFLLDKVDAEIEQRTKAGDITPTGPLPGEGNKLNVQGGILELEDEVLKEEPEMMKGLLGQRVKSSRRVLRVIPGSLKACWEDAQVLKLDFELPAGSYATAVLRELFS